MNAADLVFAGLARQAQMIRAREVSPRELTEACLSRIAELDPELNAFRSVYHERALAEADQAAARLGAGDERPLLGVPVAIKDEVDVAGDVTAIGTGAYDPAPARQDSEVVRRLRAAGAVIIGKTHVPELTMWPFTESATWGVTRNPWNPDRTPGGSSGGSGAAVAAGMVGGALGSDGMGSIRIPSSNCGLFGLKVQRGRISFAPEPEHWHGLSVLGPMTRRVADAAVFLDACHGAIAGDAASPPPPARPYAEAARTPPGRLRIALSYALPPTLHTRLSDDSRRAVESIAESLRALGHEVREADPEYAAMDGDHAVRRYLRGIHDEAAKMPRRHKLERRTKGMARLGAAYPASLIARSRAQEPEIAARLGRLWQDHDVMLAPVTATPALEVGRYEGRGALWTLAGAAWHVPYCGVWNLTGQPACSVPAGMTSAGVPIGAQLVGRANDEATLLSLAAQLEAERDWAAARPAVS